MKDEKGTFWGRWMEADEMERLKMIKTLPAFQRGNICRYMTATLFNSYLNDLYLEMKNHD